MRALFLPASGQPPTLADLPVPTPGDGEVLIRVLAAALNPLDNHLADGMLETMFEHRYPLVLGRDASGVVEAVGEGVAGIAVGDEVLAHVLFEPPFQAGTIAEFAIVSQRAVALKPIELDHITAAALPLAGGAASLMAQAIDPQPGQVVLVNGASGGVGRYAVQLLSRRGVTVVATATADDADRMRELGAAQVVDFTAGPVAEQVLALYPDGIDGLINLVGWTLDAVPVDALRAGAAVSSTTQVPDADAIAARGLTGGGIMASPTSDVFGPLAESAARGDLHVDVFRVVALHEALDGLAELASGRSRGKIVVDLTR